MLIIVFKTFFYSLNFSCDVDKVAIHLVYEVTKPLALNGTSHTEDDSMFTT